MIIGLTGKNASGKGEIAAYLTARGFTSYSLSDVLRDYLEIRRIVPTRDKLTVLGNRLRSKFGPGVLAERILKKIKENNNYVIDSFRNPSEVDVFRKKTDAFYLIAVTAPERMRFERAKRRSRENDPVTFEEFVKVDKREHSNSDRNSQDLERCARLADLTVNNDAGINDLHGKLDRKLPGVLMSIKRPGWDEYFMRIAQVVASRSNCMKRKVAAVLVKDKRIISTGYNGTPRGTKNCGDGGCPRCNSMVHSGVKLDECYCSHAEENAIVQSAYHGICIKDSMLYTTYSPCLLCAKMAINAGIKEIVYNERYVPEDKVKRLLGEAKVKLRKLGE